MQVNPAGLYPRRTRSGCWLDKRDLNRRDAAAGDAAAAGVGLDRIAAGRRVIVVAVPDERHVIAVQERESALYFSSAADSVVRRTGIVSVAAKPLSEIDFGNPRHRIAVTRMAQPAPAELAAILDRGSAWEGPVAPSAARCAAMWPIIASAISS